MKKIIICCALVLTGCHQTAPTKPGTVDHSTGVIIQKQSTSDAKIFPQDAVKDPFVLRSEEHNEAVACPPDTCLTVKIIDVGQGSTAVALLPSGESILIDAGGSGSSWANNVNDEIDDLGITDIDYLVLSHSDNDHINLINDIDALDLSTLTAIHMSGEPSDYYNQNAAGRIFMSKIYTNPGKVRTIAQCNQNKRLGVNATIYCHDNDTYGVNYLPAGFPNDPSIELYTYFLAVNVGSNTNPPTSSNAGSLVFGITYDDHKIVFPGDAEGITQDGMEDFTDEDMFQNTTLYPLAHHGATTKGSNSISWLTEVQANIYVSSSSLHQGWHHPSGELIHDIRSDPDLNSRLMNFSKHYVFSSSTYAYPEYCYCNFKSSLMSTYTNGTGTFISDGDEWEYSSTEKNTYGLVACPLTDDYC